MKQIFYKIVIVLQAVMILSTIVNLIYCVVDSSRTVFFTSTPLPFIPYFRFLENGNFGEIFLLFLFLALTVVFFIFSSKELTDRKNEKSPFLVLNIIWTILNFISMLALMDTFSGKNILKNYVPVLLFIVIFFLFFSSLAKTSDQYKVMRSKPILDKEYPLPENFQIHAKSYIQIKRTALGLPVIEASQFLLCLYIWYLNNNVVFFRNVTYLTIAIFAVILFFGIIYEYKLYIKTHIEKPPTKHFLRNLNIIQIVSFVLFAGSFFLFMFI